MNTTIARALTESSQTTSIVRLEDVTLEQVEETAFELGYETDWVETFDSDIDETPIVEIWGWTEKTGQDQQDWKLILSARRREGEL